MVKRVSWLSITPEPERELPQAVATLLHGRRPPADAVATERARIEHLVLHGTERRWLAYLHGIVDLIENRAGDRDPDVSRARARASAVLENHHNLLLALPGRGAERTARDRERLAASARQASGRQRTEDSDHQPAKGRE
jgi:hypothetical protein